MRVDLDDDEEVDVQMTPMIDCVFLLLIFFLVATTLKKIDKELPLTLPESAASVELQQPDEYTVVSIDHTGQFYQDGTPVSISLLQNQLRGKATENPDIKVRLDVDQGVEFQRFMQVLDILKFEKMTNVSINSKRDKSKLD